MGDLRSFDGDKTEKAKKVGKLLAERHGRGRGCSDRAGNKYHGRVAAIAEGARDAGLAL